MTVKSVWDGFEKAEIFGRGRYFKPDFDGVILVKKTFLQSTRNKGPAFIVDFEVLETNHDSHPVGAKQNWYVGMLQDSAFSNILGWAAACQGLEKEDITDEVKLELKDMVNRACDNPENNDFIDCKIRLCTRLVKTKTGGDFTVHDFFAVA